MLQAPSRARKRAVDFMVVEMHRGPECRTADAQIPAETRFSALPYDQGFETYTHCRDCRGRGVISIKWRKDGGLRAGDGRVAAAAHLPVVNHLMGRVRHVSMGGIGVVITVAVRIGVGFVVAVAVGHVGGGIDRRAVNGVSA